MTRRSEPVKGGVSTNDCHQRTCVPCVCGVRPVRPAFSMFQWRPAAHKTGGEMAASACTPKLWVTAKPMGSMGLDRRRERFETKQGSRLRGAPDKPLTHQRLARRGSPPQWAPRLALGKGLLSGSVSTLEAESRSGQQRAGIVIGLGSIGIFLDGRLHPRGNHHGRLRSVRNTEDRQKTERINTSAALGLLQRIYAHTLHMCR